MQAGGREQLLAARPVLRCRQQRVDPGTDLLPHGAGPRLRLLPHGLRAFDVLANRDPRDPELLRDLSLRPTFDQYLVTNDMYLIHSEHPPADPKLAASGNRP